MTTWHNYCFQFISIYDGLCYWRFIPDAQKNHPKCLELSGSIALAKISSYTLQLIGLVFDGGGKKVGITGKGALQ
jgi:hypothetical protein